MTKVILVHHSREGPMAFDIFCDGDCPVDPCPAGFFGYELPDCPWVKARGLDGYRCSEDLAHIPEVNAEVVRHINRLIREHGFTVEFAEEGWE
jgi:hypothetical protein